MHASLHGYPLHWPALSDHGAARVQGPELAPYMRLDTELPGFTALAFSPDGRELLALSSDRRLERFDLASGHVLQQVEQVRAGSLALHAFGAHTRRASLTSCLGLPHWPVAVIGHSLS